MELKELVRIGECEFIDFKVMYSTENSDLVHDILCLSNAKTQRLQPRYLIFGVRDTDFQTVGVQADPNRKTKAQIIDLLRSAGVNHIPAIELQSIEDNGMSVDILTISDLPEKPYFVTRDYRHGSKTVRSGVVYERNGDTNTPIDRCAQEKHVEWMFKQRLGLDLKPKQRAIRYLQDCENWKYDYIDGTRMYFYYEIFPEFTIEEVPHEGAARDFEEPWIMVFPDHNAFRNEFSLKVGGTKIGTLYIIWCDGARLAISQMSSKIVASVGDQNGYPRSYYHVEGSMEELFQRVLDVTYPQSSEFYFKGIVEIFKSESEAEENLLRGYESNPKAYTYFRNITGGYERMDKNGNRQITRRANK